MRRPFLAAVRNGGTAPSSRSLGLSIQQGNGHMMRWCYGQVGLAIPRRAPVRWWTT